MEVVVVAVWSHCLKVKIKELFDLERNGASTRVWKREKGSGCNGHYNHMPDLGR